MLVYILERKEIGFKVKELLIAILLLWLQIASLKDLGEVHEIQALTNPILVQQTSHSLVCLERLSTRSYRFHFGASESGVKRQAIEMATGVVKPWFSVI